MAIKSAIIISNKIKAIIIIGAAVLLIASTVLITLFISGAFNKDKPEDKNDDHKGVIGVISDNWDHNVKDPADTGQKSGTQIPGYYSAEMKAGDKSLVISIGNPKENKVGFFATVKLFDGTVLYKSPLIRPGQGLNEIPL